MTHDDIIALDNHCESLKGISANRDAVFWYLRNGFLNVPGLPMFRGDKLQSPSQISIPKDSFGPESPISLLRSRLLEFVTSRKDVGILVSGGVDSNLCLQLMSESGLKPGNDFRCFHGVFGNTKYQELEGIPSHFREFVELVNLRLDDEYLISSEFKTFLGSMMQPVNGLIAFLIFKTILYAKSQGIKHLIVPSLDVVFLQSEGQVREKRITEKSFEVTGGDGSYKVEKVNFVVDDALDIVPNFDSFSFVFDKPEDFKNCNYFYSIEPQLMFRRYPLVEFLQIGRTCGVEVWSPYNSKQILHSISSSCDAKNLWITAGKPLLKNYLMQKIPDFTPVSKVVTSPQREMLYHIVPYLIDRAKNGILAGGGLIKPGELLEYIANYTQFIESVGITELDRAFGSFNSNVLWRFFVTETWIEL